ncbi:MAG TPA: hypothetical protein IAA61_01785 [Candidatus Ornithomonoglobus merdipullorum]|uniref:Uncharacterized protein n=1 Tax=Candidatus Ornithomonoglobus merdipullorum TaxID=2840895 RepID=A0A9D1MAC0_9FIRM|nr:hypothetical protein [Candidatus Ornithomonoglobus merdipullorum]
MIVTYCPKCNRIFYSNRIGNYCRKCGSVLTDVPLDMQSVSDMSLNERYRLAYRLTNDYDNLSSEIRTRSDRTK